MEKVCKRDYLFNLKSLFIGCGFSFIICLICLTIYAMILVNTNLQENSIDIVIMCINGLSILFGSIISVKLIKNKGIINGFLVGAIHLGILYLFSSVFNGDFNLNVYSILLIISGSIVGGIGGIIGVNMKK